MKTKVSRILLLFLLLPTLALAQAPSTSVIPYSGTLFSQGKPVSQSAPVQMAFALYTDTTGLDAGQTDAAPAANRVWSSWGAGDLVLPGSPADNIADGTVSVQVRNGRFLIHLGEALADDLENSQTEIADSVFNNTSLYVVTWVAQEVEGGGYSTFRLPPQKLETVPHAVTAKRANGFEVTGDLTVDGRLTVRSDIHGINKAFVTGSGTNWDYIYHDDAANTWHFISDTSTDPDSSRVSGNSTLQANRLNLSTAGLRSLIRLDKYDIRAQVGDGSTEQSTAHYVNLSPDDGMSFCALSATEFHDTFRNESQCTCKVYRTDGLWKLYAGRVRGDGDPDCRCWAHCITWRP